MADLSMFCVHENIIPSTHNIIAPTLQRTAFIHLAPASTNRTELGAQLAAGSELVHDRAGSPSYQTENLGVDRTYRASMIWPPPASERGSGHNR